MPAAWRLKFVFDYLANTAVLCYSLTIICCCQVQDYIYWIISTENDHRHHHKFIKYEKRLRKEEKNMLGLPIKHNFCHFSANLDAYHFLEFVPTVQLIPYIYPAFVPFGRYFTSIHLSLWIRQSPLSSTRWHSLLPKNHMLFIVSKQCACSRRVHIEGHMNRFEFLFSWTIIPITIVLGLFFQKIVSFAA